MYEHIKICIFIILYFQNVASYKLYQLDSAEESKLLPRIRQLLLNQRNSQLIPVDQKANVRQMKKEQPLLKPMGKSVLVKRKIPHGYTTGEYEYDSKLNTVFKPLARYHVKKPIENHETSILNDMEFEQQQEDTSGKDLIVLVQKEESNPADLLAQVQKYINQRARQQKRKKKDRFHGMSNTYYDEDSLLSLRDKSGEEHDPHAPGKLPPGILSAESSEESKEKTIYPTYPFYNYWTYSKNVVQDRCPGALVKVGNMCISSIGHRKSEHPSNARKSSTHHKGRHSIRNARKKHLYGEKK